MVFPSLHIDADLSYKSKGLKSLFHSQDANFWEALEMKDNFEAIIKGYGLEKDNLKLGNEQNPKSSPKKLRMWCAVIQRCSCCLSIVWTSKDNFFMLCGFPHQRIIRRSVPKQRPQKSTQAQCSFVVQTYRRIRQDSLIYLILLDLNPPKPD